MRPFALCFCTPLTDMCIRVQCLETMPRQSRGKHGTRAMRTRRAISSYAPGRQQPPKEAQVTEIEEILVGCPLLGQHNRNHVLLACSHKTKRTSV